MFEVISYILLAAMLWLSYVSKKYANDAKLYMLFGKKGCGKTTDICKKAMYWRKKGRTVYTTEYIPDTYHIEPEDVGPYEFEPYSIVLVDEVGMVWDNRDFKTFSKQVRDWFKLQRHRKLTVYLYSQCFDIDKKLRDLCDDLYIIKSYFNVFSVKKKIRKDLTIVEAYGESESRITDDLKVMPWFIPGARQFTYLPKYHKYFDSFAAPELQYKEFEYIPSKLFPTRKEQLRTWLYTILKKEKPVPVSEPVFHDSQAFSSFSSRSMDCEYQLKDREHNYINIARIA